MQARHRRLTTGPESEQDSSSVSLLIGDNFDSDNSDDKKYSKRWTFTKYTTDNIPFISGLVNSAKNYAPLQSNNSSILTQPNNTLSNNNYNLSNPAVSTSQLTSSSANFEENTEIDDLLNSVTEDIEVMMTARDRTVEFSNAIRSLQGRNIARAANIRDPKQAKQLQSYSEFMMIAKNIGKNIAYTYSKLEKLTLCR